jgi:NAD(P)-dependent dehydrogenase (short-subunit alcohol dehydrogenase family)
VKYAQSRRDLAVQAPSCRRRAEGPAQRVRTPSPANGLYAATQGGVNALTKAAAIEVAKDNISVNALAFAAIDIPGDMIWRFLDSQGIALEQLVSMFPPSGEWAYPRSLSQPSATSALTRPAM